MCPINTKWPRCLAETSDGPGCLGSEKNRKGINLPERWAAGSQSSLALQKEIGRGNRCITILGSEKQLNGKWHLMAVEKLNPSQQRISQEAPGFCHDLPRPQQFSTPHMSWWRLEQAGRAKVSPQNSRHTDSPSCPGSNATASKWIQEREWMVHILITVTGLKDMQVLYKSGWANGNRWFMKAMFTLQSFF